MSWASIVPVSIALCWMLAPFALVRLGNGVGEGGPLFLVLLAFAALLSGLAVIVIRQPGLQTGDGYDPVALLLRGLGRRPAMVLTAGRISVALVLPTGLLVAAGYSFNEVFVRWFPNFGFSFILLAGIVLLHLAGERAAQAMQPVFVTIALVCLLLLLSAGLGGWWSAAAASESAQTNLTLPAALSPILLFLGYDGRSTGGCNMRRPTLFAIAVGLLLFLAWAFISMHAVPAARLAESTLPHMLAAREIAGQPGRMLMGGAVIAGVAGAVNGLFLMAGRALADLAGHGLLPEVAGKPAMTRTYPAFFAVIVGICLITGLAGHKVLEGLIEAALLLWLVHVGGLCIAVGRIPRRPEQAATIPPPLASGLGLVMLSFCLILTFTHEQALVIVCFSCAILAFTLLLSAIWPDTSRNSNTTPEKKQNHERRLS